MLKITDVKIIKVDRGTRIRGIASITIDNCFAVNDIKILEGEKGLFIAMPSKAMSNGKFQDIAHPINNETREKIQNTILEEYKQIN